MATTKARSAIDSVKANPIRPIVNTSFFADGLRAIELIRLENILPKPIPTPISATTAKPAPNILADSKSIVIPRKNLKELNVSLMHHLNKCTLIL